MTFQNKSITRVISFILPLIMFSGESFARNNIQVVGSSTVYPFTTVIAEEFGNNSAFRTPIIEATGTGGGMKLFCSGIGVSYPDFTNASRAIKKSEIARCKAKGITPIEIKVGYDGIVVANAIAGKKYKFSKKQLFLALADKVPNKSGVLIKNPYQKWNEVDASLPNIKIAVYGPPSTSGTRDAFVELVMEKVCVDMPAFKKAFPNKKLRKKHCHLIRHDGGFIEAGENDNLIVQKLRSNAQALGIFGFSFLDENRRFVQAAAIEGVNPSFDNIISGDYQVSRPLFIYLKKEHMGLIAGVKEFTREIISSDTLGEDGYLVSKGLIPLSDSELDKIQQSLAQKVK